MVIGSIPQVRTSHLFTDDLVTKIRRGLPVFTDVKPDMKIVKEEVRSAPHVLGVRPILILSGIRYLALSLLWADSQRKTKPLLWRMTPAMALALACIQVSIQPEIYD